MSADATSLAAARRAFWWVFAGTLVLKLLLAATFPFTGDEALFHGMLFIGVQVPANPQRARAAAQEALRLFAATAETTGPLPLGVTSMLTERSS